VYGNSEGARYEKAALTSLCMVAGGMLALFYAGMALDRVSVATGMLARLILFPLTPLPLVLSAFRLTRRHKLGLVGVLAALVALIDGGAPAYLIAVMGLVGVVMAEALERRWSAGGVVMSATAVFVGCVWAAGLLFPAFSPEKVVRGIGSGAAEQRLEELYEHMPPGTDGEMGPSGIPAEGLRLLTRRVIALKYGLVAASTGFHMWLLFLVARSISRSFQFRPTLEAGDLTLWTAPEKLVWALVGALAVVTLDYMGFNLPGFAPVARNLLLVLAAIYFFHGLAVAAFYVRRHLHARWLRGLAYAFFFMPPNLMMSVLMVAGVGLFDMWANFRRLPRTPAGGPPARPTHGNTGPGEGR